MVLNYIWIALILIAFVVALFKWVFLGDVQVFAQVVEATYSYSKTGFEISLGLTGTLALWLGLMRIGERGGAIDIVNRVMGPFFSRLFPDIPRNHPALGSIMMNFSANMLGLDNAATPMGLKAMQEMQEINPRKDTASNPMIMFLVLNTSGLTVIPITIMVYRAQQGAANPADIFIPLLLATITSTLAGMLLIGLLQRINFLDKVLLAYITATVAFVAGLIWFFSGMPADQVQLISNVASNIILLGIIVSFISLAMFKGLNVYELFIEGAKDGFQTAVRIIPYLIGILVAVGMFRQSGAMDLVMDGIRWFLALFSIDDRFVDAIPVALMKPLSGSGSRGLMVDAMKTFGADSFVGRLTCIMQGSADTTLYIIAVYFGSVNIRKTRYAAMGGLFCDLVGAVASVFIAYFFFG